ncbi:fibronectin type III domain-containing protein [Chitinimonas sp.]|uniref:fibronectin type III domain-containing protein n=1 Tax=Chitinimonas sp. TaxID=1934313 RepID=UPI0035AECB4F
MKTSLKRLVVMMAMLPLGLAHGAELACSSGAAPTDHPRLYVRNADLDRLRTWAVPSNPLYEQGIKTLAQNGVRMMDGGTLLSSDNGGTTYSPVYTEAWAHLFAFMSLVSPNPAERSDYAQRARTLLMTVINAVDSGSGSKWRSDSFASSDRGRWVGHTLPLAADWIYPCLTPDDRAAVRRVFLKWAQNNVDGYPSLLYYHSRPGTVPAGDAALNNPVLLDLADPKRRMLRYGMNNYFMAHGRNLAMYALAIDPSDDVADPRVAADSNGKLRSYLKTALQKYYYVTDHALRNDGQGGVSAEGMEYYHSLSFSLQMLLAVYTAGELDPAKWGPQLDLNNHPFWGKVAEGYIHAMPARKINSEHGSVYQPSWFGDGEHLYEQDQIDIFGAMGVLNGYLGKSSEVQKIRWIESVIPPGGETRLVNRARFDENINGSIMNFLLFDPAMAGNPANGPAIDPRPGMATSFFSPGLGRLNARTGWDNDARQLDYKLSYITIDHQHGDGNMFDFYRKGEWLTKERTGYGATAASSDYKNTLTLQNDPAGSSLGSIQDIYAARGSQFALGASAGSPTLVSRSAGTGYVQLTGDATNLYNLTREYGSALSGIEHASRSLVWLQPDHIVVYDRARSTQANRAKAWWLNMPGVPTISGNSFSATTPGGQKLAVRSLLPAGAEPRWVNSDPTLESWAMATMDPMGGGSSTGQNRIMVAAPGAPREAAFLHVIQGADAGATIDNATLVSSNSGSALEGAAVGSNLVLFTKRLDQPFTGSSYIAPAGARTHYIVGLTPNTSYRYSVSNVASGRQIDLGGSNGSSATTDSGGVLVLALDDAPAATLPGAPLNVSAVAGVQSANVSFSAPAGNGSAAISGYTVVSSPAGGVDSNAGSSSLNHLLTGLTAGTPYTFTVVASNASGSGPASAPSAPVTPLAAPKTAQTISFADPGNQQVGATITLAASASSQLPVSLSSTTPTVCSLNGNIATMLAVGTCSLLAEQAGNTQFAAAPRVVRDLLVSAAPGSNTQGSVQLSAVASGPVGARTLTATVISANEDRGKAKNLYVMAYIPTFNLLFFLSNRGWQQWTEGGMPALRQTSADRVDFNVFGSALDLSSFNGTQIYLGFAPDAVDLLLHKKYSLVYQEAH